MSASPAPKLARHRLRTLLAIVLLTLTTPLAAHDVAGLYSATAAVIDRSPRELARGTIAALADVLIKLTGNRHLPADASVRPLLAKAARLVLQYGYASAPAAGLQLNLQFDEQALNSELQALGLATWGKARPETLTWLIVDSANGRQVINNEEPGALGETLLRRGAQRALPLLLPLPDAEETQVLTSAAHWDALASSALAFASRHPTAAVLIGYLKQSGPQLWEAHWKLQVGLDLLEWTQDGDLSESIVEGGVDALGDALARRYADPTMLAAAERLSLSVIGVRSAADYARLSVYLDSLDTIAQLFVKAVDNERVVYEVIARGGRAALAQSIAFGHVLAPVPTLSDAYQLQP